MTKLKALYVIQGREYILQLCGAAGEARVQAAMSPAARDAVYSPALVPTDWIDVAHSLEHIASYDATFSQGARWEASDRMISEMMAAHYKGLYRSVFATARPINVLEKSARLWNRFYDSGESQLIVHSSTAATKRIVGCRDLPLHHERLIIPYYDELLRQSGASHVVSRHTKCVALGADCCETVTQWRERERYY